MTKRPANRKAAAPRPVTGAPRAEREPASAPRSTQEAAPDATPSPVLDVAPIRVEVHSALDGWPAQSRFDVLLRGRIISAAPADTFTIRDPSGQEMAAVQFGHGGNQQAESLPGGGGRVQHRLSGLPAAARRRRG